MKIEKLNENKIKITFNIDDLAEKNIDLYSFLHNTPETQDLFWDILSEAEKECGFNVDNSMIYVEASTSGAGNFIIIVTKTNEKPNRLLGNSLKKKNIKLKRKTDSSTSGTNIYQIVNFDDICELANVLDLSTMGDNTLYQMNETYYLKMSRISFVNIMEYATICPNVSLTEARLNEYGTVIIAHQALQIIHKYFNKKRRN